MGDPDRIELIIAGTPAARPRPRARAMKMPTGKWVGRMYQPKGGRRGTKEEKAWARAHAWHDLVKTALWQSGSRPSEPWTGPIRLTIDVYFERPKRLHRKRDPDLPMWAPVMPDRDNLDKAVMDALTEAGLYVDDSQVVDGPVRKWYAAKGCGPGVIIVAERLQ